MGDTIREVLRDKIPTDTAGQVDVYKMIGLNRDLFQSQVDVLDLGAGTGDAHAKLSSRIPNMKYVGLDIEDSPEVERGPALT